MADDYCFDEDGDVILKVNQEHPYVLRVLSKTLMRASPVFAALLGPHFREGQVKRSSQEPAEVALLEDNGNAMVMICQQLHPSRGGPSSQGSTMDAAEVLDYAIAVDKYGLVSTLRLQAEAMLLAWLLKDGHAAKGLDDYLKIIAASYLLKQKQAFKMATKHAVNMKSLAADLQHARCWTLLPSSVVVVMAERIAMLRYSSTCAPLGGLCLTCVQEQAELRLACDGHKDNSTIWDA